MKRSLILPPELRDRLLREDRLSIDQAEREVIVGLSFDESARLIEYWQSSTLPPRHELKEKFELEERHNRAHVWWRRSSILSDESDGEMTSEDAFEVGRAAWDSRSSLSDIVKHAQDFDSMIVKVPRNRHLAAIHGWLNAFEDEADRLKLR